MKSQRKSKQEGLLKNIKGFKVQHREKKIQIKWNLKKEYQKVQMDTNQIWSLEKDLKAWETVEI